MFRNRNMIKILIISSLKNITVERRRKDGERERKKIF